MTGGSSDARLPGALATSSSAGAQYGSWFGDEDAARRLLLGAIPQLVHMNALDIAKAVTLGSGFNVSTTLPGPQLTCYAAPTGYQAIGPAFVSSMHRCAWWVSFQATFPGFNLLTFADLVCVGIGPSAASTFLGAMLGAFGTVSAWVGPAADTTKTHLGLVTNDGGSGYGGTLTSAVANGLKHTYRIFHDPVAGLITVHDNGVQVATRSNANLAALDGPGFLWVADVNPTGALMIDQLAFGAEQ